MKRYIIPVLIVLVLASGVLVACAQKVSPTEIYQNEKYGYSLEVPKTCTTTISEEEIGHTATFAPLHNQIEITVKVSSEEALNNSYTEARGRGVDVEGMTPLELVVRYHATDQMELGGEGKRIDWNEHVVTTFTSLRQKDGRVG